MRSKLWLFLTFVLVLPLVLQSNPALAAVNAPQDVKLTYGFVQDSADTQLLTAVVYPNISSEDAILSTAVFTFLLPAGTQTSPSIPEAPASAAFTDITGIWTVQKVTPALYASVGFDAADLQGRDVYQAVLSPGSATPALVADQAVSLFSFRLPNDCIGAGIEVLANDSAIQQALLASIGANFNNQMSMSVDGTPAMDQYAGNHVSGANLSCPGGTEISNTYYLPLVQQ
ncbi:MAG: hypothetical protein KDD84_22945 [Caldilineaceae bacterium]|nr:hypothetical protein [Caldilineaceae bacterium]